MTIVKNTTAKANSFGREVDPWIQSLWPRAQRKGRGLEGCDYTDTGDFAFELKNHARMRLGEWITQVTLDAKMEKREYPVVIHKRRRYTRGDCYVTMTLETFTKMLASERGIDLPDDLLPVSDPSDIPDWDEEDDDDE